MRDPRYDPLFEPIRLGPVTAKNRFYQVPHCNGMGHAMPHAHAAMREVKAEGGWAVVSTEECEIHPSGDVSPYVEARLWDDHDIPALQLMCEKVHAHGALENRVRLLREVLEDTKDAVGDTCAVALRFATEELLGPGGIERAESEDIVALLAELPDLWDVNVAAWYNDSVPSRFAPEGAQEPFVDFVKRSTSKPVVGVGRFTSPDTMLSQLRRGVLDIIGAARPSIADPFLPNKIAEGRSDDIRECIGCNICVTGDMTITPIRCTQNPTMGEEWRKGWHPERMPAKGSDARVLVVGAGPAGLEAARALGQRGYEVHVAEATRAPGGRVTREAALPGLAEWARVRDWRLQQIARMGNVAIYPDNALSAEDVLGFGAEHVLLATGARWRRDGYGRSNFFPDAALAADPAVFTPDDVMDGVFAARAPAGPVVVFDDDGFYLASVLAERLRADGREVLLLTPDDAIAPWSANTLEYRHVHKRLHALGVGMLVAHNLVAHPPSGLSGGGLR